MQSEATVAHQLAARSEASRLAALREAIQSLREIGDPLEAPDPVLVIDVKLESLDDLYTHTPWGEFADEAARVYVESMARLQDAREVSVRIEEAKAGHPV